MEMPEGHIMINKQPMPEAHRRHYNKVTLKINELEAQGRDKEAEDWRDHRHAVMQMAIIATMDDCKARA